MKKSIIMALFALILSVPAVYAAEEVKDCKATALENCKKKGLAGDLLTKCQTEEEGKLCTDKQTTAQKPEEKK